MFIVSRILYWDKEWFKIRKLRTSVLTWILTSWDSSIFLATGSVSSIANSSRPPYHSHWTTHIVCTPIVPQRWFIGRMSTGKTSNLPYSKRWSATESSYSTQLNDERWCFYRIWFRWSRSEEEGCLRSLSLLSWSSSYVDWISLPKNDGYGTVLDLLCLFLSICVGHFHFPFRAQANFCVQSILINLPQVPWMQMHWCILSHSYFWYCGAIDDDSFCKACFVWMKSSHNSCTYRIRMARKWYWITSCSVVHRLKNVRFKNDFVVEIS